MAKFLSSGCRNDSVKAVGNCGLRLRNWLLDVVRCDENCASYVAPLAGTKPVTPGTVSKMCCVSRPVVDPPRKELIGVTAYWYCDTQSITVSCAPSAASADSRARSTSTRITARLGLFSSTCRI